MDALFNTARVSEKKADGKFPSVFKGVSCWFLRGNSVSSSSYGMKDSYHFSEFTLEVMNIDGRCLPSLLVTFRDVYLLKRYLKMKGKKVGEITKKLPFQQLILAFFKKLSMQNETF